MTPSCAELGETCAATTVALGIVVFVSATYAAATFRPVMPILIWIGVAATRDATLAKCRCVEARAEKNVLYHSAGVVDTRHFAKIRVSQGDLRSKINEASCITVGLFDTDSGVKRCEHGARSAECLQRAA